MEMKKRESKPAEIGENPLLCWSKVLDLGIEEAGIGGGGIRFALAL